MDLLPEVLIIINVHATPRPALARMRHDARLLLQLEHRKTRKDEGVAIHDLLSA